MFKTHLKTAIRSFYKNKTFSFINILGLTLGLSACFLVLTVALDDLSYDRFWKRTDDLYRVYSENKMGNGIYLKEAYTPIGLGTELKEHFPEVEAFSAVRLSELHFKAGMDESSRHNVNVMTADSSALKMFDFVKINGQLTHHIVGEKNIILTESLAKRLFKDEDAVGKYVYDVPSWKERSTSYFVTAIIQDLPQNTHLRAEAIILEIPKTERIEKNQGATIHTIYYLLKPGTNIKRFEAKVNDWYRRHLDIERGKVKFIFQPMKDLYLHSDYNARQQIRSNMRSVYIFGAVGFFLLLIACINFINLSTARAITRLKESGIRKILGADRRQLIGQFLTEALFFFAIATALSLFLYALTIPVLEKFLGHQLTLTIFDYWPFFLSILVFTLILSIITGFYPAIFLSGFNPANSLRGRIFTSSSTSSTVFRRTLVIVQFSIAIITLITLLVVHAQLEFINRRDLGFKKENLLYIDHVSWQGKGETIKTQLAQLPGVLNAAITSWQPQSGMATSWMNFDHPKRKEEQVKVNIIWGDIDFAETIGLTLKKGRIFNKGFGTDVQSRSEDETDTEKTENSNQSLQSPVLISESTAKDFGIEKENTPVPATSYTAVGIVKDFYFESLHHALMPTFISAEQGVDYGGMFIRIMPGKEEQVLSGLHKIWKAAFQDKLLSANWMDEIVNKHYEKEHKQQLLFTFFSGLMLFISSLGVFGLVLHTVEQRVKEIGIRKVLGASIAGIATMLSKDFVKLVILASVVASPIAWWVTNKWLDDFAYRVEVSWWLFVIAGIVSLFVALITISFQTIRAATANPVDSLRNE
ncbi:FtsX-like permease family protein [Olivibacter sp. CPCC 100613]|uniref:ABC transporter permease n=1 Tax=Olivibacter sp. CPCC 100613 TaxID=3079931 RepID=UPI002FF76A48